MFITEARDLPRSVAVLEIMRIPVRVAAGNGNEPTDKKEVRD